MTLQELVLRPRGRAERVSWVVFCVAGATLVRCLFAPIVGGKLPWMTFAFATLVATVFAGRASGIVTALLGAGAGTALSLVYGGSPAIGAIDGISATAYLLAASGIVIVGDAARTAFLDLEAERSRLAAVLQVGRVGYWDVDLRTGTGVLSMSRHGPPGHDGAAAPTDIREWRSLVHPDDNPRVQAEWNRALRERVDFHAEYRLRLRGESMHWVYGSGRFVYDAAGVPVRALGAFYETTDLKRADEAERLLSLHAENSPLAIVEWDADYRVVRWSADAERVFGWTADEVRGKRIDAFPIVYEEDASAVDAVMRGMEDGTATRNVSLNRNRRKDGRIIHCAWYNSALRDEMGKIVSVYSQVLDRTREVEAQHALRASEERFRLATEAMTGLVYEVDRATGAVRRSRALMEITGFDPAVVSPTQEWWLGRVHPDDYEHVHAMDRAIAAGARTVSAEYRVRHRDGHYVWVWDHAVVGTDDDGRPASQIGCIVGIHERKQMEEALRDADRRKDEFLAMLAHELRNPLAPIRNAVHVLRTLGGDGDAATRAFDMIDRQVSHMARLVDDLLEVSRITRGLIALRTERLSLAELVRDAVETTRPMVEQHEHSLSMTLADGIELDGDRARLVQVVSNVLANAAKFTPAGGHISVVTARVAPDRATISVRDTGIGVPEELQDRVFDLFAQEDAGLSRSQGGLGIGLTLVKRLVEMHGGDVRLSSRGRGHGTLVTITIPVAPPAAARAEPAPAFRATPTAQAHGLRLLVVEDNPDTRESFEMLLALDGHDVRTVATGVKTLRLLEGFRPDAAFIDLGLPDMDGYELARRLRADPRTASAFLVAVSGYGREEDKAACARAGFDVHLTKPVAVDAIRAVLARRGGAGDGYDVGAVQHTGSS